MPQGCHARIIVPYGLRVYPGSLPHAATILSLDADAVRLAEAHAAAGRWPDAAKALSKARRPGTVAFPLADQDALLYVKTGEIKGVGNR
jgi:thiazole synthase ThiGH ThiG subunit